MECSEKTFIRTREWVSTNQIIRLQMLFSPPFLFAFITIVWPFFWRHLCKDFWSRPADESFRALEELGALEALGFT